MGRRVLVLGFGVWGLEFVLKVQGSGEGTFRVQGSEFQVSGNERLGGFDVGFGFRVPGFKFRGSGFRFRVSGLGFRVSGFGVGTFNAQELVAEVV